MTKTNIEWVQNPDGSRGRTWNPVTGCDRVSPGCDHCYALTMAARLKAAGAPAYQRDGNPLTSGPGFGLTLHAERLEQPIHWQKPSLIFVNSMSDLFHGRVPFEFVERVWQTMAETPQHTYQVLTKRPDRMARFSLRLPLLSNVWLGTSVEDQQRTARLKHLLATRAVIRFVSAEPLLGPVDLSEWLSWRSLGDDFPPVISWVIAGGESGPGARPCELGWLRSLRDQCRDLGVAFFLKQLGGHPDKRGHDAAVLDGRRWVEMPT